MHLYKLVVPGMAEGLYVRATDSHEMSRMLNAPNAPIPIFTSEQRGKDTVNFKDHDTLVLVRQCSAAIDCGECT